MKNPIAAIGIELIVDDLDRALELFVDVVGCTLISRGPAVLLSGEVATVDAGNIIISLIRPDNEGMGASIARRAGRLSQIIFGTADTDVPAARARAVGAGLSITNLPGGRFAITSDATRSAIGVDTSLVTVPVEDD